MCECGLAEQPCDAQPTHGARHIRVLNVHHLLLLWILRRLDFVMQEGRAIFGGELLVDRVQNDLISSPCPSISLSAQFHLSDDDAQGSNFSSNLHKHHIRLPSHTSPLGCKPHLKSHQHNGT